LAQVFGVGGVERAEPFKLDRQCPAGGAAVGAVALDESAAAVATPDVLVDVGFRNVGVVGEAGQRAGGDVAGGRVGEGGVVASQQLGQVDLVVAGPCHGLGALGVRERTQHFGRIELSSPHQFLGRGEVLDVEGTGHSGRLAGGTVVVTAGVVVLASHTIR
jgi:hypothetical protein